MRRSAGGTVAGTLEGRQGGHVLSACGLGVVGGLARTARNSLPGHFHLAPPPASWVCR